MLGVKFMLKGRDRHQEAPLWAREDREAIKGEKLPTVFLPW
jgi:hypothetical protein